jgi:hypothetical protein
MARALDLEEAKERFRQAAEKLGDQTLGAFLNTPARSAVWAAVGAAGLGVLLGRGGGLRKTLLAALPMLLQLAGQLETKENDASSERNS